MNFYKVVLGVAFGGTIAAAALASKGGHSPGGARSTNGPASLNSEREPPYRRLNFSSATVNIPSARLPSPAEAAEATEPTPSPPPPPEPALPPPRNEMLEGILASAAQNGAWESEVTAQFAAKYGSASDLHISALRCSDTFCRIELTLPSTDEAQAAAIDGLKQMFEVDGPLMLDVNQTSQPPVGLMYVSKKGARVPFPPPRRRTGT